MNQTDDAYTENDEYIQALSKIKEIVLRESGLTVIEPMSKFEVDIVIIARVMAKLYNNARQEK